MNIATVFCVRAIAVDKATQAIFYCTVTKVLLGQVRQDGERKSYSYSRVRESV